MQHTTIRLRVEQIQVLIQDLVEGGLTLKQLASSS